MKQSELLEEIKETLQREEILTLDMKLEHLKEWNSLANISIIALFDQLFDVVFAADVILKCQTINDLLQLVSDKLEN
jgi:acyl carrier protein